MNKREFPFGNVQLDGKKKKKSRWNKQEQDKTFIPGMPTVIPPSLSKEQEEQYLIHLQVEEISRRLRSGDLGIPPNPEDRSPSPEPIYNNEGKRLNTREYRTRKRLEEERHNLVQKAFELNADYKPPSDYKPPVIRVSDKVMIPQEDHPDINFVGLLIGPRGNTLKNLEKETGAKIIIRGKGSVKEGKVGRKDGQPLPGEDEPLHAYVTANNPEHVKKAVERVKQIIKEGIEVPEGQNDLRRQQLRELALLNGTLRENDGLAKLKQLAQAQTIVTNTIICTKCGGTGHIAQDCKLPKPGDTLRQFDLQTHTADKAKMDSEYMSLMAELGEGPPPPKQNEPPRMQQPGGRFNQPPPMSGPGWRHGPPPGVQPPGMPGINMQQPPPMIRTSQPPPVVMSQPQTLSSNPHQPPQQALPPPGMVSQPLSLGSAPTAVVAPPTLVTQPTLATPPAPPVGTVVSQPPPSFSQQQGQVQTVVSQVSQPPPMVAPPAPIVSSAPLAPPPWSTSQPGQMSAPVPPHSSSSGPGGVGPPPMMAPPPPPPVSQPTSLPWQPQQQPDCHWSTGMNMGMPPAGAPWQQPGGMVPPPPPSNLPPWQTPPPPGGQPGGIPPGPPPPPPGQHLGMAAPPPPPPVGRPSVGMPSGIPLGVPPPPPPN